HGVGVPFALYWQEEYAPEQADIELCIPVTRVLDDRRSTSRVVPAARCIVTVHRGPYDSIGESYSRAIRSMETRGNCLSFPFVSDTCAVPNPASTRETSSPK
ncbi:MAG: GyrI-like domain-containing protein, partial [Spirochaetaceae bacterium]|nr:GyrI-like domain-containing protein [Spirochaetaceae bacterium]